MTPTLGKTENICLAGRTRTSARRAATPAAEVDGHCAHDDTKHGANPCRHDGDAPGVAHNRPLLNLQIALGESNLDTADESALYQHAEWARWIGVHDYGVRDYKTLGWHMP